VRPHYSCRLLFLDNAFPKNSDPQGRGFRVEPFFLTDPQKERLERTNNCLRQLNRSARTELQRFGRTNLTDKQYRQAGLSFEMIAMRIVGVLQLREEILDAAQEKGPDTVEFIISILCADCVEPPDGREHNPDGSHQVPEPDPGHLLELNDVLEFAHEIGERVLSRTAQAQATFGHFVIGLKRLTNALRRQRRHYRDTQPNPPAPKVQFVKDLKACPQCHKPHASPIITQDR